MAFSVARWWVVLVGGALIGAGMLLYAEVTTMYSLRDEVHDTFFLWRAIGQVTFVWQDDVTQAALWADECPPNVIEESERGAFTMMALGAVLCVGSVFLRKPRPKKRR